MVSNPGAQPTLNSQEIPEDEAGRAVRLAKEAEEEDERQDAKREQDKAVNKVKAALNDKNLAICVGSGVTLYSTAQTDQDKTIRANLTWTGLIKSGLRYLDRLDVGAAPESRDMAIDLARQVLNNKNASMDNLLDAANTLPRLLKKHYATWLALQFEDLASDVNHPSILTCLNKLHKKGATLFTTNYDGLVEKWCGLPAVDGSNPGDVARWKRKQLDGVFHPHGYWTAPDTIVLTTTDYYKVRQAPDVQSALQSILGVRTVLFVGCGGGLNDPNFGKLLDEIPSDIGFNHYILLPSIDTPTPVRDKPVITVRCSGRDEIGPWLAKLLGEEEAEGNINDIPDTHERKKIHAWLAPLDQGVFLTDISDLEEPGTCDWLSKEDQRIGHFLRRNNPSLIWLYGENGCGKTVLCSSIVNAAHSFCRLAELGRSRDSLAYFYCSTFDVYEQDTTACQHDFGAFLRTVIDQLCPPQHVYPAIQTLYHKCTRKHPKRPPRTQEVEDILFEIFEHLDNSSVAVGSGSRISGSAKISTRPGEVYLIIDGLDKIPIPKRASYLKFIKRLAIRKFQHVNILVSSRDEGNLRATFRDNGEWVEILVSRDLMEDSMRTFVTNALQGDSQLKALPLSTKKTIECRLIDEKRGSFRWISDRIRLLMQLEDFSQSEIDKVLPPKSSESKVNSPSDDGDDDYGNDGGGGRDDKGSVGAKPSSDHVDSGERRDADSSGTTSQWNVHHDGGRTYRAPTGMNLPSDHADSRVRDDMEFLFFDTKTDKNPRSGEDSDKWLERCDDFLETWLSPTIDSPSKLSNVIVKIAILDTGFDENDPFIRGARDRIAETRSWVSGDDAAVGMNMRDDTGHGTHAMALLLRMSPQANIYAAKIAKRRFLPSLSKELIAAVAAAIEWATHTAKVDILILPFGFKVSTPEIEMALRVAYQENILIFCATGSDQEVAYPARSRSVIGISSTNSMGRISEFSPTLRSGVANFATLGEEVQSSWPRILTEKGAPRSMRCSGTSVATVIAASIASKLLEYGHAADFRPGLYRILRSSEGMEALLKSLSLVNERFLYIWPWGMFSSDRLDPRRSTMNDWMERTLESVQRM